MEPSGGSVGFIARLGRWWGKAHDAVPHKAGEVFGKCAATLLVIWLFFRWTEACQLRSKRQISKKFMQRCGDYLNNGAKFSFEHISDTKNWKHFLKQTCIFSRLYKRHINLSDNQDNLFLSCSCSWSFNKNLPVLSCICIHLYTYDYVDYSCYSYITNRRWSLENKFLVSAFEM